MEALDCQYQTMRIYGIDGAGNRSPEPLSRTYQVDMIPPVVNVTTWVQHIPPGVAALALSGTVSDGSGAADVYVLVRAPDATMSSDLAVRTGGQWSYALAAPTEGVYTLWIEARDAEGNTTGLGPFDVTVGLTRIYLPLIFRKR